MFIFADQSRLMLFYVYFERLRLLSICYFCTIFFTQLVQTSSSLVIVRCRTIFSFGFSYYVVPLKYILNNFESRDLHFPHVALIFFFTRAHHTLIYLHVGHIVFMAMVDDPVKLASISFCRTRTLHIFTSLFMLLNWYRYMQHYHQ